MASKLSSAICVIAALVTVCLLLFSTTSEDLAAFSVGHVLVLLFYVGPYAAFAFIAWSTRAKPIARVVWLILVVLTALLGLFTFGEHCYRFQSQPEYRMGQWLGGFFVALLQWLTAAVIVVVLVIHLGWRTIRHKARQAVEQVTPADADRPRR